MQGENETPIPLPVERRTQATAIESLTVPEPGITRILLPLEIKSENELLHSNAKEIYKQQIERIKQYFSAITPKTEGAYDISQVINNLSSQLTQSNLTPEQAQNTTSDIHYLNSIQEKTAAQTDSLTGLYTRRGILNQLEDIYNHPEKFFPEGADNIMKKKISIFFTDIDYFKDVNDKYGHTAGDEALVAFTDTMKEKVRDTDLIERHGGEEMVVFMLGADENDAHIVDANIVGRLKEIEVPTGNPNKPKETVKIEFSAGACLVTWKQIKECFKANNPGKKLGELLKPADDALYEAKKEGRNQLRIAE